MPFNENDLKELGDKDLLNLAEDIKNVSCKKDSPIYRIKQMILEAANEIKDKGLSQSKL